MMEDPVTKRIGKWGTWQRNIFILLSLKGILGSWQVFSANFTAPEVDHWCARPGNSVYSNWTVDEWKKFAIPTRENSFVEPGGNKSTVMYSQCEMFDVSAGHPKSDRIIPCKSFEYDHSVFPETITSEWDLVCGKKAIRRLFNGVYMAGYFVGVLVFGVVSDRFGRRRALLWTCLLFAVFSVAMSFCKNLYILMVIRFISAGGRAGMSVVAFVLMMELISGSYRSTIGIGGSAFFSLGCLTLPAVAYFIRPWRQLQFAISAPAVFTVSYYWYMPESPRWLLSKGKIQEAEKILKEAEETNGTSQRILSECDATSSSSIAAIELTVGNAAGKAEIKKSGTEASLIHLFKTPNMRKITLLLYYIWFVNAFVYYGLSLNIGDLGGDVYLNAAISGIMEVLALLCTTCAIMRLGRKLPLCAALIIGGLACMLTITVPRGHFAKDWPVTALAAVGKFGITSSFSILYIVSAELFPTVVRNSGVGSSSMVARIGSTIAPFVPLLDDAAGGFRVSMLLYGGTSALAGIAALFLPETHRKPLPETMDDGENLK